MENTKELIAHVNDLVAAAKPIADQCEWMVLSPKSLAEIELEQFVGLCEWRDIKPTIFVGRFQFTADIEGVSVKVSTARIPELIQREEPSVLDLIKSILADRKANAVAA